MCLFVFHLKWIKMMTLAYQVSSRFVCFPFSPLLRFLLLSFSCCRCARLLINAQIDRHSNRLITPSSFSVRACLWLFGFLPSFLPSFWFPSGSFRYDIDSRIVLTNRSCYGSPSCSCRQLAFGFIHHRVCIHNKLCSEALQQRVVCNFVAQNFA